MGKRRGQGGGGHSDQYGEFGVSQDREEHFSQFSSGKGTGGGTAGQRSGRAGGELSFQRQVPKFLQKYSHLLGQKKQDEDEPTVEDPYKHRDEDDDGGDGEDAVEQEAIHRALQDNPELAAQLGSKYADKVAAAVEKDKGNSAFSERRYQLAISHFSRAIELDPRNEVYFSNRSAAHAALLQYEEALRDALSVLALKPGWVKGHARQAVALFGLKQYGAAREAYQQALRLEPDDQALQRGLEKSEALEMQQMREHKHVFKKARLGAQMEQQQRKQEMGGGSKAGGGSKRADAGAADSQAAVGKAGKGKGKAMLSFADDEEEGS